MLSVFKNFNVNKETKKENKRKKLTRGAYNRSPLGTAKAFGTTEHAYIKEIVLFHYNLVIVIL